MCRIGDTILVQNATKNGSPIGKHSFIVYSVKDDEVQGLDFDIVAFIMSSFKSKSQKEWKLSFPGNFPIVPNDSIIIDNKSNNRHGYVAIDQYFFFNKNKVDYKVIGQIKPEIFNLLVEYIEEMKKKGMPVKIIKDNL